MDFILMIKQQKEILKQNSLDEFPSPEELWEKYKAYKGIQTKEQADVVEQDYFKDSSGKVPRYYQRIAINRTVEAIAKGEDRILLVMATGTGKLHIVYLKLDRKRKYCF